MCVTSWSIAIFHAGLRLSTLVALRVDSVPVGMTKNKPLLHNKLWRVSDSEG